MRGPDDPGEAKMPATEAKPPDPGNLTRRGGEEHEQRTLQEDNPGELDDQAVQSITEAENGDDDEHMPLASQDSIVAETSDSQEEVPVEDTGENQGKKTDKFDLRSASQTKEAPDRGDSPTEKMMNEAAEGQHQEKQPDPLMRSECPQ
uniref:Uncharacterized protein n=1 Tax=Phytophthora ramorum TaxID=164328 RepID=H3GXB0_PHYRM